MKRLAGMMTAMAAYLSGTSTNMMPGAGGNLMSTDMRLATIPNDWDDPKQADLTLTAVEAWDVADMTEGYGDVKPDVDGIKADDSVFISALNMGVEGVTTMDLPGYPPVINGDGGTATIKADDSIFLAANTGGGTGCNPSASAYPDGWIALKRSIDTIVGPARRAMDTAIAALSPIDTSIGPQRRLALAT